MSNAAVAPVVPPLGRWRLVHPPAAVTAASDAIIAACSDWRPSLVEVPVASMATREEAICHAVQDWSAWNMDRSAAEHLFGFAGGVSTGVVLSLVAVLAWRASKAVAGRVVDGLRRVSWSDRRSWGG